jgi:hypothetical protein
MRARERATEDRHRRLGRGLEPQDVRTEADGDRSLGDEGCALVVRESSLRADEDRPRTFRDPVCRPNPVEERALRGRIEE